jgi:hypothetical protein
MLAPSERKRVASWLGGTDAGGEEYADAFLKSLGAAQQTAIDASKYEGAQVIHNLNARLPPELHNRFSCLIDGGTLEHVFDIREALRSCMLMVKPGGHLIICQMANNCMGHGLYQFSPELFYCTLTPENGYRIKLMALSESDVWYEPLSPAQTRDRIQARTAGEAYVYVVAERIADIEPFATAPHQVDYAENLSMTGEEQVRRATADTPIRRLRKRVGDITRRYVYSALPWLGILEERYVRYRYMYPDRLTNKRRFRMIGRRLLAGMVGVAASMHAAELARYAATSGSLT